MVDKISRGEVLALMADGWSCWKGHNGGRWTLQQGKAGHGGETKHPHGATMLSLDRNGLIKALPYKMASFRTDYVLTTRPQRGAKNG